jgi:uncharacterized C2H2 Zn-finger protein
MDNFTQYILQISSVFQDIPLGMKQEEAIICNICHAEFSNLKGLRLHEGRIHSASEKNIKCCECLKLFKNKYSLKIHVKQVHDKTTREPCPKCEKVLYNKYMLKKHIKKNHPAIANIQ